VTSRRHAGSGQFGFLVNKSGVGRRLRLVRMRRAGNLLSVEWMRQRSAWWSSLAALVLFGCGIPDWGTSDPPAADCSEGAEECSGDGSLRICARFDADYTYWASQSCPAASVCRSFGDGSGSCVLPGVACDAGATSTCANGAVHACAGGLALAEETERCTGDASCALVAASTVRIPSSGDTVAVCTIDPSPCKPAVKSECRDGAVFECSPEGYPLSRSDCPADEPCTEGAIATETLAVARCNPQIPCPPEQGSECSNNEVYYCDGVFRVVREDCGEHTCVDVGSFGACYRASDGPAELSWQTIPGGAFVAGDPHSGEPGGTVNLESYEMLSTEVTVGQFMSCVAAGSCVAKPASRITVPGEPSGDLPMTSVDALQARAFCAMVGGTLPTEYEWEYAARNAGANVDYPWGDAAPTCSKAVIGYPAADENHPDAACARNVVPPCSRAPDITAQGVCDLVGDVSEWVLELPDVAGKTATRGANAFTDPTYRDGASIWVQDLLTDTAYTTTVGFRCVRHAQVAP
jgi:formylglycine-generating enzyme required for sulfatase activity